MSAWKQKNKKSKSQDCKLILHPQFQRVIKSDWKVCWNFQTRLSINWKWRQSIFCVLQSLVCLVKNVHESHLHLVGSVDDVNGGALRLWAWEKSMLGAPHVHEKSIKSADSLVDITRLQQPCCVTRCCDPFTWFSPREALISGFL